MKLQFEASPQQVEIVNMLLAQAIKECGKPHIRNAFGLTSTQVKAVDRFRKNMLDSFLGRQNATGSETGK